MSNRQAAKRIAFLLIDFGPFRELDEYHYKTPPLSASVIEAAFHRGSLCKYQEATLVLCEYTYRDQFYTRMQESTLDRGAVSTTELSAFSSR